MLVALVDDADDAVGAHRLAVRAGEPAADILDPEPRVRRRVGTDAILNLIGDAAAVVALVRLHDGVEARLRVLGLEHLGIGAAGRDRGDVGDEQHRGGVGAPMQRVGVDAPVVGHLADRVEDFGRVDAGPVRCAGRDRIARTGVGQSRLIGIAASDEKRRCQAKLAPEPKEFGKSRGRRGTPLARYGESSNQCPVSGQGGAREQRSRSFGESRSSRPPLTNVRATSRANADFVAHLIATSAQAPQTRARRRANSEDADRRLRRTRPLADTGRA